MGGYSRTNLTESVNIIGHSDGVNSTVVSPRNAGDTITGRMHAAVNASGANTSSLGLFAVARTTSNAQAVWKNGSSVASSVTASVGIVNNSMYVLAINSSGTAAQFNTKQCSMAFIGAGSVGQLLLFNAIEAYMDSIGAGVV